MIITGCHISPTRVRVIVKSDYSVWYNALNTPRTNAAAMITGEIARPMIRMITIHILIVPFFFATMLSDAL